MTATALQTRNPFMSKAQAKQLERVKEDEKIEAQKQQLKNDMKCTQRAGWNEALEEASERKSLINKYQEIKNEVKLANRSLVEVRKAQLHELLQYENMLYKEELESLGLTIYKDRL